MSREFNSILDAIGRTPLAVVLTKKSAPAGVITRADLINYWAKERGNDRV